MNATPTLPMPDVLTPDVSIIIPVFNQCQLTRTCLASLERTLPGDLRCEVIVVDNASQDDTPEFLAEFQSRRPWLRAIRNETNLGFAKACNQGVRASRAPAVLLLNNDTEALPNWLQPMIRTLYSRPNVAAVGSKLLFDDRTIQHAGVLLIDATSHGDPLGGTHVYFRYPADHPPAQERSVYPVVTGACLLTKRHAFDAVGGFDEEFWNGYEDVDLCLRFKQHGWICVYEPESILYHHESKSGPERFRCVKHNTQRLHAKWLGKVKPDFATTPTGELVRRSTEGIYPYVGAERLTYDDVLAAIRQAPPTAEGMELATLKKREPAQPKNASAYNIVLVEPEGYEHSGAFGEIAELLSSSLRSLGLSAQVRKNYIDQEATNVILGYQLLPRPAELQSSRHIIYQLEQLSDREGWFEPRLLEMLTAADEVWDYAEENVAFLAAKGLTAVRHLPLGYHEKMRRIARQTQDIDVLFYGSLNPRRREVLERIGKFARVVCLASVYGAERDEYIARAKIVLNIHFYEAQIMEQARICHLLNNHSFVISESSPSNPFGESLVTTPIEQMEELVRHYLESPRERHLKAREAFAAFQARPMTELLRPIVLPTDSARRSA